MIFRHFGHTCGRCHEKKKHAIRRAFFTSDYPDSALTFPANARDETMRDVGCMYARWGRNGKTGVEPEPARRLPCCGFIPQAAGGRVRSGKATSVCYNSVLQLRA